MTINEEDIIVLVEQELSGGNISKDRIDTLADMPGDRLRISGLRQDTFEYLIESHGDRFRRIEFWKCPKVHDLTAIENLPEIREIAWHYNQKATGLWDLSKTPNLAELEVVDFRHLTNLNDLLGSNSLTSLYLDGGMWRHAKLDSLDPLSTLAQLQSLWFSATVLDGRLEPLTRINSLTTLDFPMRLFPTEQVAWLKARLGDRVESSVLAPYRRLPEAFVFNKDGEKLDVLVVGKRKPYLSSARDGERLSKYVTSFNRMVEAYRSNPSAPEPIQ